MRESLKEYCMRYGREDLLEQWHPTHNGRLTARDISFGSQKQVWWRCEQGHEWEAPPFSRAGKGSGCPYCTGKRVAPGQDLQSVYPEIARQWHPVRNGASGPETVLPGSHKSVWWQCDRGHSWRAMVKTRVEGKGCPICSGKAVVSGHNDLRTLQPAIARQWHPTRNGRLTPDQITCGSERKVWWRCGKGHEWQAPVSSRTAGKGCPVCSGKVVVPGQNDLQSFSPELAQQWHQEKNGKLLPSQVCVTSNKRVWWRCSLGHTWQSAISSRTAAGTACPYCAGRKVLPGFNDLRTVQPLVAAQWHPTRNGTLDPTMVTSGCSRKVWWRCTDGHEWKAVIYSRTGAKKCGCPVCAGKAPVLR